MITNVLRGPLRSAPTTPVPTGGGEVVFGRSRCDVTRGGSAGGAEVAAFAGE